MAIQISFREFLGRCCQSSKFTEKFKCICKSKIIKTRLLVLHSIRVEELFGTCRLILRLLSLFENFFWNSLTLDAFSCPATLLPDWLGIRIVTKRWKRQMKTNVFSAMAPSRRREIRKHTCISSMMERSPTIATSVVTRLLVLLSWKDTYWFTVERSHSVANSATIPARKLVTSRRTC